MATDNAVHEALAILRGPEPVAWLAEVTELLEGAAGAGRPGDGADALRGALQANLSPRALAAIAGLLGADAGAVEKPVGDEVIEFRSLLIHLVDDLAHEAWADLWAGLSVQDANRGS